MQVLIDENLPRDVARLFKECGYQTTHVLDTPLRGKSDEKIAQFALANRLTIVTADKDFSDIRHYPPHEYSGIIVFRFRDETAHGQILNLARSLLKNEELLTEIRGKLVIVDENQIRVRQP
ncbi:MAG: DUF5615 family PIN-like protein [Turneriella sp.]